MDVVLPDRPFGGHELGAFGLSEKKLRRLLDVGDVRRVVRGVFVDAALPDTIELRVAAVAAVIAENHVVVDRTAAWLHGVDVLTYAEKEVAPPLEICALRSRNPTHRTGIDAGSRDLIPRDVVTLAGVRITTPLRTAMDLGCRLRRREALAAVVELVRRHQLTAADLRAELPRFRGRRGVIQLRQLLPLVDPRIESQRESWVWLAIHDAGLPMPEPQVWIEIDGVATYRLDFAYRRLRVCVEYDGIDAHEQTPEQHAYDERRRAWLRAHGWTVIVVRRGDFSGDRLDAWLAELRAALVPTYRNRRW